MLKVRVIPTMLWKHHGLVKGVSFDSWRRVGVVMPAIRVYNSRDVDELVLVDIAATQEGERPDHLSIEDLSPESAVPFSVGGGIRDLEDIINLLHAGADKVIINSALYDHPDLLEKAAGRFGTQCIVASIDARKEPDGSWQCYSHSGTKPRGRSPESVAREFTDRGAGEILLTSIDRDGTFQGYDIPLIQSVVQCVDIPVIASGGAGKYEDLVVAVKEGGAAAVAAASIFHFTELTPAGAKAALEAAGIPIRRNLEPINIDL